MKEAGMRIRIEPVLRDQFMAVCRSQDLPAAQVIRSFIKGYVHASLGSTTASVKPVDQSGQTATVTQ
jgi:hypothetical protein